MLAGGRRINQQCGRYIFFKRNSIKRFFNNFYFYYGFIFVKKYFEKLKKVFLFCEKLFLKKFFCGKVFGLKFSGKSCFAEKMFAESTRKKFWKKKFPQSWQQKNISGKSFYLAKILAQHLAGKGTLQKRNGREVVAEKFREDNGREVSRSRSFPGKVFTWQRL